MSRSKRSTPIISFTTSRSEKQDKRVANRKFRRLTTHKIRTHDNEALPVRLKEVSNIYTFSKDGKQWVGEKHPKYLRK